MKVVVLFLIMVFLAPFRALAQEEQDYELEQQEESSELTEDLFNQIERLAENVDSLRIVNNSLKEMWNESQRETDRYKNRNMQLQQRVDSLNRLQTNAVRHLEASNDSLRRNLITMSSYFIYVPYHNYCVQQIAIPAFESVRGSELYRKHHIRLELLENYSSDLNALIGFLDRASNNVWRSQLSTNVQRKASEALSELRSLPMYQRYTAYNDWKNTYLGKYIVRIEQILENPGSLSTELTASKAELTTIRNELSTLIRN